MNSFQPLSQTQATERPLKRSVSAVYWILTPGLTTILFLVQTGLSHLGLKMTHCLQQPIQIILSYKSHGLMRLHFAAGAMEDCRHLLSGKKRLKVQTVGFILGAMTEMENPMRFSLILATSLV